MIVIPAVDLLDGKCVRLKQGSYSDVTVYSENPLDVARKFEDDGAKLIHIVDLNGAKDGSPVNYSVIEKIVKSVSVPIEVGGGIRDTETAAKYVSLGVKRIIIGTKAFERPDFIKELKSSVNAEVVAGIDAKNGMVAVKGWTEITSLTAKELALLLEKEGADAIIYTDISRDGMRTGPNIEATVELAKTVKIPLIASGGVAEEEDIIEMSKYPIWGIIVGKAIYEGSVNLKSVIKKIEGESFGN
ncbi:MAG: 1-(5-phosphoribosyl)-5-[(5-phosphoribosylamino) methylideneamino]imidazole-4-carboxamide isomerase [bacterium]